MSALTHGVAWVAKGRLVQPKWSPNSAGGWDVAQVPMYQQKGEQIALLIAAAPEMQTALLGALNQVDADRAAGIAEPPWAAGARAAIAKSLVGKS
ncbi:MAG: hypothetical protein IV107_23985 [Paucibacter sp.]|nr:hypothetical protein [Roseateles sp.]